MRAKHRAANNKYLQGGVRKSTRLTILVVIYTLFLTVTIIAHAKEGMRDSRSSQYSSAYGRCVSCSV